MKSAILFGNGLNLVGGNNYSWNDLLESLGKETELLNSLPPNMSYEYLYLNPKTNFKDDNKKSKEERFKEAIVRRVEKFAHNEYYDRLIELPVNDFLTTNYDNAFVKEELDFINSSKSEKIYSIIRWFHYKFKERDIVLYHIHGHIRPIASMMLGIDQYTGAVRRVDQWVKGEYKRGDVDNLEKVPSIIQRLQNRMGGHPQSSLPSECGLVETPTKLYSWIDAFFFRNLSIIGLGLDYCESDIWWLLVKRARIKQSHPGLIENTIKYYVTDPLHLINRDKLNFLRNLDVVVVLHSNLSGIDGNTVDYKSIYIEQMEKLRIDIVASSTQALF